MYESNPYTKLGALFRQISHPTRLKIMFLIGEGEACVCHLEAQLGLRQAYLSQHLMAMRDAGLLTTERDGRFIYYRLANTAILDLVRAAGKVADIHETELAAVDGKKKVCSCPKCS